MASLSNTEISRDQLLGIRAACIIGIVVGHSFLIYPFLQGNEWRIPILLLLGGTSAIKDRPLKSTIYFIFKSFYLYVFLWTIFYTIALQIMGSDIYGKYILVDSLPKLLTTHMFINNMHGNLLTLANWFLIPYGIGLIVVSIIRKFITKKQVPSAIIAMIFLVFSFYLAEASPS